MSRVEFRGAERLSRPVSGPGVWAGKAVAGGVGADWRAGDRRLTDQRAADRRAAERQGIGLYDGDGVCSTERAARISTPVRRLVGEPKHILRGLVRLGDVVADIGCGPGFFTLPLAAAVGEVGRVIAVDLRGGMAHRLRGRAARRGLLERITLRECIGGSLGLHENDSLDFALAFWVLHETPDPVGVLRQVRDALRPGGRVLVAEPVGRVGKEEWQRLVEVAGAAGLVFVERRRVAFSRAMLLERPKEVTEAPRPAPALVAGVSWRRRPRLNAPS